MAVDPEFLLSITVFLENVPFPEKFSILTVSPQMAPPATKVGVSLDPAVWGSSGPASADCDPSPPAVDLESSPPAPDPEASEGEGSALEDTTVFVELRIATREDALA